LVQALDAGNKQSCGSGAEGQHTEASSDLLGSGGHIVVAGGGNLKASGQRQQMNAAAGMEK
jgi:hypothetical protein